jgi:histidyl-tRNA synthetase
MANQALPLTPPKGMRDFGAEEMRKRRFIFERLRNVFLTFGFEGIETPSMERMEVLTGKYGQEGDRLIFKVLNSGDFMKAVQEAQLPEPNSKQMLGLISEKALRYDLTIPIYTLTSS